MRVTRRANSATATGFGAGRLADEDSTYWFLREGLGWHVVLQIVWVMDTAVPGDVLEQWNVGLAGGRLHRRLRPSPVPGARPRWVPAGAGPEVLIDDVAVGDDDIERWAAAELATVQLDAVAGRCWRLRSVITGSGASVISLCALHLATDGRSMVRAAAEAMPAVVATGMPVDLAADDRNSGSAEAGRWLAGDLIDAAGRFAAAAWGVGRAVRTLVAHRLMADADETEPQRPARPPMADRSPNARTSWATATIPAEQWDRVADAHGGTSNALLVAVVTGLLRSSGYAPLGDAVKVGIPMDRRAGDDDTRANATTGASVILTDEPVPSAGLGRVRAACKEAYLRTESGARPPTAYLRPLVWVLPSSWLVGAATAGNGMPDAMVSNLGALPPGADRVGGHVAQRMTFRGMAQGVRAELPYRFGDGVQAWSVRTGDHVSFSVLGCDEERFADDSELGRLLAEELAAWGLSFEIW
ncbi:hypothetical protein GCM10009624_19100 [Gordonia sinesedis]